ncbi:DUF4259 domain-containing protein [Amycolatopsis thermalba]|uniref:DUF4259 domain-containing protein n=1 Tax=Amycolatopsis thermalba TaxID=944492 RepID=A0ABY4P5U7_9PSEU|nr:MULTISPECIES: DUF4259 domain-containing protein [Amycolatopsis]UQS27533.1 DUF4259 domain-containing protein [Amycolatopsis thermalba]
MGTGGIGHFDNDEAADFANELDDLPAGERVALIRTTLETAADDSGYLEAPEGMLAVAAAALVASQVPDGDPVDDSYGPEEPLPALPAELRPLAVRAIDRVLGEKSELDELWEEPDRPSWPAEIDRLRTVLAAG